MAHDHSASNTSMNATSAALSSAMDDDRDIVAMWLTFDAKRWKAGALAGLFAGMVSLAFAMILSQVTGSELWFPARFAAIPFLGGTAMRYDNTQAILVGFLTHELLAMILGMVYAHFTSVNSFPTLLGAGFVWGTFSWVFISCLFVQSFVDISALNVPKSAFFPVNLVFGLSLASVAFFDRALKNR